MYDIKCDLTLIALRSFFVFSPLQPYPDAIMLGLSRASLSNFSRACIYALTTNPLDKQRQLARTGNKEEISKAADSPIPCHWQT